MTLIDRLSKLEGPDREVDAMLYCFQHGHTYSRKYGNDYAMWVEGVPHEVKIMDRYLEKFTASVDAAIGLAERALPGWVFDNVGQDFHSVPGGYEAFGWNVELINGTRVQGQAPTFPLAICIALLRAKEASNG